MKKIVFLPILLTILSCGSQNPLSLNTDYHCDSAGKLVSISSQLYNDGDEYLIQFDVAGTLISAVADTGSSNLIVEPDTGLVPHDPTDNVYCIHYGAGSEKTQTIAAEYLDTVGLKQGTDNSSCATNNKQKAQFASYGFGLIEQGSTVNQSILGLAYRRLEQNPKTGTCSGDSISNNHTFVSDLVTNTGIQDEFSMLLCGQDEAQYSRIIFGDSGAAESEFQYVKILEKTWYVIEAGKVTIEGENVGSLADSGQDTIVDSGTTLNLVPPNILKAIVSKLAGRGGLPGVSSPFFTKEGSLLNCNAINLADLPPIQIALGNQVTLSIAPKTYIKQTKNKSQCLFGFASNQGGINILGQVTMENYWVRFDRATANRRIGFKPNTGLCGS